MYSEHDTIEKIIEDYNNRHNLHLINSKNTSNYNSIKVIKCNNYDRLFESHYIIHPHQFGL